MDWDHAIKRNSEVLAGIVESLFMMLGLVGEATVSRISWPAYRAVLRVLRPAESALRRLTPAHLRILLRQAGLVDRATKGMAQGEPWEYLTALVMSLAGSPTLSAQSVRLAISD